MYVKKNKFYIRLENLIQKLKNNEFYNEEVYRVFSDILYNTCVLGYQPALYVNLIRFYPPITNCLDRMLYDEKILYYYYIDNQVWKLNWEKNINESNYNHFKRYDNFLLIGFKNINDCYDLEKMNLSLEPIPLLPDELKLILVNSNISLDYLTIIDEIITNIYWKNQNFRNHIISSNSKNMFSKILNLDSVPKDPWTLDCFYVNWRLNYYYKKEFMPIQSYKYFCIINKFKNVDNSDFKIYYMYFKEKSDQIFNDKLSTKNTI